MANEALRLIKIMQGGYALPVPTGSRFLKKVSATSSEEFNRKIYNLLDHVKTMEHKYKVLDPRSVTKDPKYSEYGPVALISTVHQLYGRLITDHDWPALATKLPQSNNASANEGRQSRPSSRAGSDDRKCYRCQGPHLINDCPNKGTKKAASEPAAKKIKTELPAWRYLEPKDLTKPLVDEDGRTWKFCTKCVCRKSGKTGMYLLSHFDSEHPDNFTRDANEGNMAAVDVPLGVPAVTTIAPSGSPSAFDEDPIEFQGAWCACVDLTEVERMFCETVDDDSDDDVSTFDLDDPVEAIPFSRLLSKGRWTSRDPMFRTRTLNPKRQTPKGSLPSSISVLLKGSLPSRTSFMLKGRLSIMFRHHRPFHLYHLLRSSIH